MKFHFISSVMSLSLPGGRPWLNILSIPEMEKLSIEDVLKLEWKCLNREIKKWIRAMKIIVERSWHWEHTPEKKFCLLDMHEVLEQLARDVDILFF
ncbi:hypothetical protein VNO78_22897 [Psophocarpus tetragonolobus]|uniref:Uncharacterized protein n=1 Tax=Psophocarpus tetragonolobus TaxID=3891 RepID=A0AAN9XD01_PSOTE